MLYGQEEKLSLGEYFTTKPTWIWVLILLFIVFGCAFGLFGVYQLVSTNEQEIVTSSDMQSQVCEQSADFGQITVYISGAITNPGVYILGSGDRLVDLLEAAGGLSSNADVVFIHKQFNLAQQLHDGGQFYIPTFSETEDQLASQLVLQQIPSYTNVQTAKNEDSKSNEQILEQPISINSSTKSELMELSGIGEARATKIIDNRPFLIITELVSKGIISQSLFSQIERQIIL